MNKIEKLINKFCPDGVNFKELGEVLGYIQPIKNLDLKDIPNPILKVYREINRV